MKFLSESGLTYFLNKLKGLFLTITDFNKVYDNGVIDAKQVVHKTNSGSSTNYDLVLGNKTDDESDSYIKIDSTRSVNSNGDYKNGLMSINSVDSFNLKARGTINLSTKTNNISINSFNAIHFTGDYFDFVPKDTSKNYILNVSQLGRIYLRNYKGKYENLYINVDTVDSASDSQDKIQFFVEKGSDDNGNTVNTTALDIRPERITCWNNGIIITKDSDFRVFNNVQVDKDTEVKIRTSGDNTMRLTEGEGFKVFANMYAMPDHATDISGYTEEEQQLLADNTVQKLILKLNSSKASAKTVKKIAKQTIQQPKVCVRKAININSVNENVWYFHKGAPTIKLYDGNYRIYVDGMALDLDTGCNCAKKMEHLGSNIFKLSGNESDSAMTGWIILYYLEYSYIKEYVKVESVQELSENGIDFIEVRLVSKGIEAFSNIVNTTSPYFSIVNGEVVGNFIPKLLPSVDTSVPGKYDDNKTFIAVVKHRNMATYDKNLQTYITGDNAHKYYIVNKRGGKDNTYSRMYRGHRGTAVLKYYRKNILIGERNVMLYNGNIIQ